MWSSLPDELVLCILLMIDDGALPLATRLDKRCNRFTRERLSSLKRLTQQPFNVKTSDVFNLTLLRLSEKQIGNQGITALVSTLGNGALANCTYISLCGNQIGDVGFTALASACASGALPQLQELYLHFNSIGDVGLSALADVVSRGALPKIEWLSIGSPSAELKSACEARGIEM